MIFKVFSVFDSKAEAYITPFFLPTKAMAIRAFTQCVQNPEHQFGKTPQDYTLFEIGEYDDSIGEIDSTTNKAINNGVEVINNEQARPHLLSSSEG